jgi:hypothetical protein
MRVQERSKHDHVTMILSPDRWPQSWFLPIKRKKKTETGYEWECGIICDPPRDESRFTVYLINLFEIDASTDWAKVPKIPYSAAVEIVDNGWIVD